MARTSVARAHTVADSNLASDAGAKVTVALKMPNGLRLRIFDMHARHEPVMGGGSREVKEAVLAGEAYLNGAAKRIEDQFGCDVVGGYALTKNISKDLWERWYADNKDSLLVLNNLIFADEDHGYIVDQAKEFGAGKSPVRSNLEPMDQEPMDDPRTPKGGPIVIERGERK